MKKFGCFMIILMMAVSGLALLPASYTHSENTITSTSAIDKISEKDGLHIYYPENYMHLSEPNIVASSDKYIVASNDTDLYVYDNISKQGYVQTKVFNKSIFTISQIAVLGDCALILETSTQENKVLLKDLSDRTATPKDVTPDSQIGTIYAISVKDDMFALIDHKNNKLTYVSVIDGKLEIKSSEEIPVGTLTMLQAKIFDNELYFYYSGILYQYNFEQQKISEILNKPNIGDYIVVDNAVIYTQIAKLYKYDITTKKVAYSQPINNQKDTLSVFGDQIYLTDSTNNQILVLDKDLNQISYYGDKGGEIDRLNTPLGVSYDIEQIYIADSENHRIIVTNSLGGDRQGIDTGDIKPILTTKTTDSLYVLASDHMVYKQSADNSFARFGKYENVIDMDRYEDKLVILTASEVIVVAPNGDEQKIACEGVNDIIVPYGTNRLYTFTDTEIIKYDIDKGEKLSSTLAPATNAKYAIDYYGNLYALDNGSITKYNLQEDQYKPSSRIDLPELNGATHCTINTYNGNMYLTKANTHLLYSVDRALLKSTSIKDDSYTHPTEYNILKVAKVNTPNAHSYITPKNTESARNVPEGTEVLILAEEKIDNIDYYYVAYADDDEQNYIKKSDLSAPYEHIAMQDKSMSLLLDTPIYQYPFYHSRVIKENLKRNTIVNVRYNLTSGSKDWDWCQVTYTDNGSTQIGYVKCNYLAPITETTPPKPVQFLTTKSKNVGEKIKLYSEPDVNSSVLEDSIDDGVELQMIQEHFDKNSQFTKVRYNNQDGYILTENLQEDGLTPSQIIAITVSVVAAVAFILIIVLLFQKKKTDKKPTDYSSLQ